MMQIPPIPELTEGRPKGQASLSQLRSTVRTAEAHRDIALGSRDPLDIEDAAGLARVAADTAIRLASAIRFYGGKDAAEAEGLGNVADQAAIAAANHARAMAKHAAQERTARSDDALRELRRVLGPGVDQVLRTDPQAVAAWEAVRKAVDLIRFRIEVADQE